MDKDMCKFEFGKENVEEVRKECIEILKNIRKVIDIKGLNYVETFVRIINIQEGDK